MIRPTVVLFRRPASGAASAPPAVPTASFSAAASATGARLSSSVPAEAFNRGEDKNATSVVRLPLPFTIPCITCRQSKTDFHALGNVALAELPELREQAPSEVASKLNLQHCGSSSMLQWCHSPRTAWGPPSQLLLRFCTLQRAPPVKKPRSKRPVRLPRALPRSETQSTRGDTPAKNSVSSQMKSPARACMMFVTSATVLLLQLPTNASPVAGAAAAGACMV